MNREHTLLIIEDDILFLKAVSLYLRSQGFRVLTAHNGLNGLRLVREERPSMVILDLKLPQLDGYQICQRLRAEPETANLPILMLTARGQLTDKMAGFQAGADAYMIKPIYFADLMHYIDALLSRSDQAGFPSLPHSRSPQVREREI